MLYRDFKSESLNELLSKVALWLFKYIRLSSSESLITIPFEKDIFVDFV